MPRIVDLICLALIMPVLIPVILLVGLSVWLGIGRPIFFTQPRGGHKGTIFEIYKFRTMTNARDASGNLLPDAQRLTWFGNFLRSTSLDELPSLWNLLKGDIRLVGPRPFIADYLELYTDEQRRRHDVKPGITGWAQINGRNALSWEDKFALDIWYVDNRSFLLDVRILWLTLLRVLSRSGISAQDDVTMPRFTGTN